MIRIYIGSGVPADPERTPHVATEIRLTFTVAGALNVKLWRKLKPPKGWKKIPYRPYMATCKGLTLVEFNLSEFPVKEELEEECANMAAKLAIIASPIKD